MRPAAVQALPDLDLRVHAPIPEVVIVRVSGSVNMQTAPLLAERVDQQLTRAPHVVIDLGEVGFLDARGLGILVMLHQQAVTSGTQIHLVGTEHDAVRRPLRVTGLDQFLTLDPTADAVIAQHRGWPGRDSWRDTPQPAPSPDPGNTSRARTTAADSIMRSAAAARSYSQAQQPGDSRRT